MNAVWHLGAVLAMLAVHDQVRVVNGLAEPGEQVEDVGVVVQQRALLDVRVERVSS